MIEPVVQIVEQALFESEGGAHGCGAVAEGIPCEADARLRQELRAVVGEGGGADGGIGVDDAVGELVVCGAAIRLIPAIAAFHAKAGAHFETRGRLPDIFDIAGAEPGAPVERRRRGDDGEGLDGALEKCLQSGEGCLPILVLREVVVALETLQPAADFELMTAGCPVDVIVEGEEIACDGVVAADVAACAGDLRCAVRSCGTGDDDGADGPAADEAGNIDGGRAEEVERAREKPKRAVLSNCEEKTCCSSMLSDLLAQCFVDDGEGVGGGRVGGGVVDGVDAEEKILCAKVVVGACGAEVFTDGLLRIAEGARDAGGLAGGWIGQFGAVGRGPELQKISDAGREADIDERAAGTDGKISLARVRIGDEGDVAEAEVLSVTFVVAEEEDLVAADGAAE